MSAKRKLERGSTGRLVTVGLAFACNLSAVVFPHSVRRKIAAAVAQRLKMLLAGAQHGALPRPLSAKLTAPEAGRPFLSRWNLRARGERLPSTRGRRAANHTPQRISEEANEAPLTNLVEGIWELKGVRSYDDFKSLWNSFGVTPTKPV